MSEDTPYPAAEDIHRICLDLGFEVEDDAADRLARYVGLLAKWNRAVNLVGPEHWRDIFTDLVADSLHLHRFLAGLDHAAEPLCLDLGAGAGLPGIPLRILWPEGNYHLIEPRRKRALFMRTVLGELKLPGTFVFHGRAEDADFVGADLILSRAFLPWPRLLPFARPMLSLAGRVVVLASEPAPEPAPEGWELLDCADYPAGKETRYFWGLAPAS